MIYEKYLEAWENQDAGLWMSIFHEDYEFLLHSDNKLIRYGEGSIERVVNLMVELKVESRRCIYENDDILIMHTVATFPNGDREAVLASCLLKDGKIWRQETGATPLPPKD